MRVISVCCIVFVFFPSRGMRIFEAKWLGHKALYSKGASFALPSERSQMLSPGSLWRCLGDGVPPLCWHL
jgi:hypothetical protein